MHRLMVLMLSLSAAVLPTASSWAGGALATAPIDYSLYREGEVQRSERLFAGWLLTCDEIPRLRERFCSLRSVARSADGTVVAAVAISTDEQGRPAALVTLPFGTSLRSGAIVLSERPRSKRDKPRAITLRASQCGGLGCQAFWSVTSDDIGDLRAGNAVQLTFNMTSRPPTLSDVALSAPLKTVTGTLDAVGFASALEASTK